MLEEKKMLFLALSVQKVYHLCSRSEFYLHFKIIGKFTLILKNNSKMDHCKHTIFEVVKLRQLSYIKLILPLIMF